MHFAFELIQIFLKSKFQNQKLNEMKANRIYIVLKKKKINDLNVNDAMFRTV